VSTIKALADNPTWLRPAEILDQFALTPAQWAYWCRVAGVTDDRSAYSDALLCRILAPAGWELRAGAWHFTRPKRNPAR